MAILHVIGGIFATVALVPAPREQAWRDGSCAFAGKEVRFVRDAALPPEGYRLDIAPAAPRDFEGFKRRMEVHRRRLIADGVNCAPVE